MTRGNSPRRRLMGTWVAHGVVMALVVASVAACGSDGACSDFAVDLARTSGGAASAVEAARNLSELGGFDLPADGWTPSGSDATGQLVSSGRATLHALQGHDGTWFIDSGRCG